MESLDLFGLELWERGFQLSREAQSGAAARDCPLGLQQSLSAPQAGPSRPCAPHSVRAVMHGLEPTPFRPFFPGKGLLSGWPGVELVFMPTKECTDRCLLGKVWNHHCTRRRGKRLALTLLPPGWPAQSQACFLFTFSNQTNTREAGKPPCRQIPLKPVDPGCVLICLLLTPDLD